MSRFISAVHRLSAASTPTFLHRRHPLLRQPQTPPPTPPSRHPSPRHSLYHFRTRFYSTAAVRISSTAAPAVPISLTSILCCQFVLFSNLSRSVASGAKQIEDIVGILLEIRLLLQRRFYQQCMQDMFLMCGTVVSMVFPVVQALINAAVEGLAERTAVFFLVFAGAGLLVKLFWVKLFRLRPIHT